MFYHYDAAALPLPLTCNCRYVNSFRGVYRPAGTEIVRARGGPCGILLFHDTNPKTSEEMEETAGPDLASASYGGTPPMSRQSKKSDKDGEEGLGATSPRDEEGTGTGAGARLGSGMEDDGEAAGSDSDEDTHDEEDDVMAALMDQIDELETEKVHTSFDCFLYQSTKKYFKTNCLSLILYYCYVDNVYLESLEIIFICFLS